ncbi:AAA family ATPase [Trinickia soli]|uniref:Endonuclease GajA/Old nuclease/RecF-like AAA domain-containing protein n=1 Tax=Trinickia soli TaxID=380675 RepID=A0A2N7VW71_9BURK|nr:AAA family ATPase [Trinickia soli]PMS21383.1 hypothetical protein C0Z19_18295 [Trinickia soli]CAB3699927.1 hypothetical protein LMG24076_03373 [Trinickia soli]
MTLHAVGVKNLRALVDSEFIELKPITLLVGKNSVGKSTFARVFPLLRQSNEEKRRAPVLWWGKYVDFGSFRDAVHRNADVREVSLCFDIMLEPESEPFLMDPWWSQTLPLAGPTRFQLEVAFACGSDDNTYIKRTEIRADGMSCTVHTSQNMAVEKIICGDVNWTPSTDVSAHGAAGELLPMVTFFRHFRAKDRTFRKPQNPFIAELNDSIRKLAHPKTKDETIAQIVNLVPLGSGAEVLSALQAVNGSSTWKKNTSKLRTTSPELTHIRELVWLAHLEEVFSSLNSEIRTFSKGVRYLEPLRATAQRYYRVQELAVDEVDSKGANLAVFIHSMQAFDRDRFNEWLKTHLGFEVRSVPDGGHISLRVRFVDDNDDTNLTDTGFGMSQVLPIATQLWSSQAMRPRRGSDNAPTCFVVEQPELHLHPAFQEKIADLFVASLEASSSAKQNPMRIVAETHSSSLINRLGELVAEGRIDRDDVQVVMFDQTSVSAPVKIQISQFDEEGVLQNWPYGFFASGKSQ